jgi:hypothetical protein
MSQGQESDIDFFPQAYTDYLVDYAQTMVNDGKEKADKMDIIPYETWYKSLETEFKKHIAKVVQEAVASKLQSVPLMTMRSWFQNVHTSSTQVQPRKNDTPFPLMTVQTVQQAAIHATDSMLMTAGTGVQPLTNYENKTSPAPDPLNFVLLQPQLINTNSVALRPKEANEDYCLVEKLTKYFDEIFKLYKINSSSSMIAPPKHLSIEAISHLTIKIKEEVFNTIKEPKQVQDANSGEITMACVDYQDYQRGCGISTDCGCYEKFKVPHFYFSTRGVPFTEEQIAKMSPQQIQEARTSTHVKAPILNCDKNRVSKNCLAYQPLSNRYYTSICVLTFIR